VMYEQFINSLGIETDIEWMEALSQIEII
jgi:hypothetical protein